jgi:hypothetical protein
LKEGDEAAQQFGELATALREIGAGWVVDEVVETAARGKTVLLASLPEEELSVFRDKLSAEDKKGLPVGRIGKGDEATVPYSAAERLAMLVDAADRVISATAEAHRYVVNFAAGEGFAAVRFELPEGLDTVAAPGFPRAIALQVPQDLDTRVQLVRALLDEASR